MQIPKISDLYNAILLDIETELGATVPRYGKSFLKAIAMVQAAKLKLSYIALSNVQKNIFVDTADPESLGGTLERFGRVKIGRGPLPPTQGVYKLLVDGSLGATIPVNTTFVASDVSANPGVLYICDTAYTLSSSPFEIEVRCLTAGVGGRLNTDDELRLTAPLAYVDNVATVISEVVIPNDGESYDEYRRVVLESYRLSPQGGAAADYRIWAQDASGVKQVYPYAVSGAPGEIDVYVEATVADSDDGKGTPTVYILDEVEQVLEMDLSTGKGRRPLTVWSINVQSVVVNDIMIRLSGFSGLTDVKKHTIQEALTNMVNNIRPFVAGTDILSERNDTLDTNRVVAAILEVLPGESFAAPVMEYSIASSSPVSFVSRKFDYGNIPYLNQIVYV